VIWAAVLLVIALVVVAVWAWYILGRHIPATTKAEQSRVLRLTATVSSGVGAAILVLGVVGFVLSGYDWLVLAPMWAFGLFHFCVLGLLLRRAQRIGDKSRAA
jgi:hypothetical protein